MLNPQQKKAVQATEGPLLIFAGAGSGKTMVIIHRIARLLKKGVPSDNILAVTFTNKAAEEMRERIKKMAGPAGMSVWMFTFHSLAARILRLDGSKEFTIYDAHDQIMAIKECIKKLNLESKKLVPTKIKEIISQAKNNLMDVESFLINAQVRSDKLKETLGMVYAEYQKLLRQNGGYDFADLLVETIRLFKENPLILEKYRRKFKYIMVDEYQDTNYAQYILIKMLVPPDNNICVVGDDDQCLIKGTKVYSDESLPVSIQKLKQGDKVKGASGWGKSCIDKCNKIFKRKYKGKVVNIVTNSGKNLIATPNHILFGKLHPVAGMYYVYLMFKKNMGFRIGITQGVRSKRKSNNVVSGLSVRLNQEHADKIWIIKTCNSLKKAVFLEQYYAFQYGIPMYVFHDKGRKMAMSQNKIDELFASVNTYHRAEKLMKDLMLNPLYPHIIAGGFANRHIDRKIVNFTMFGENPIGQLRPWHVHRIQLNTSNKSLREIVEKIGFTTRIAKKNTWRIEASRKNYDAGLNIIKRLESTKEVEIVKKSHLTKGKSFCFLPASQIHTGMIVPIIKDNKIVEDVVKSISIENYEGYVYDISMPNLRNYIADGFVVHNSIYSWRGADIRNILEFEKNFKDSKVLKLEENYRSTQNILTAADNVIKNNESRAFKKLWTKNKTGEIVKWQEFESGRNEAIGVISEIKRLIRDEGISAGNIAIFYRTNAQSRTFEDVLRSFGMNYKIIGGLKFYERKEIKDILAYMKVIINPFDDIGMLRIINYPNRGLGKKSISDIKQMAMNNAKSIYQTITDSEIKFVDKLEKKLNPLRVLLKQLKNTSQQDDAGTLAKEVIELSGYHNMLKETDDLQARTRAENIKELVSAFNEKENREKSISEILNEISLLTDVDSFRQDDEYITLMTVHLSKGLEFSSVFLTGMEETLFPHYDAINDTSEMEEERRLCYVGMTRAKELLYLTSACKRMLYGQSRYHIPSRFIKECLGESKDICYTYD